MRFSAHRRRSVILASGLLLAVALIPQSTVAATTGPVPKATVEPHRPDPVRSVPVTQVGVSPAPTSASERAVNQRQAKTWPAAYRGVVDLTGSGETARASSRIMAGAVELRLRAAASARSGAFPRRIAVEVLDRAAALRLGVDGVILRLKRADGFTATGTITVSVDYGPFADAYGGDWAQRLGFVELAAAGRRPLSSRNDTDRSVVATDVTVASTEQTVALTAAEFGATGDFKATSMSPSGNWAVSTQSGGFSWSQAFRVPPVPGGLVPQVVASYDSTVADGRTVSTNNQPSWAGEGWSLWPGFVERSYKGCADDLGGNNGQTKTGDLCWETDNASISFGGRSGPLVFGNGAWHLTKDDGTRVERLVGSSNGDNNGESWKVTTTDGTQYIFGARTDSAWTVPVFGNDLNEQCRRDTFAQSVCEQAYRWNLDQVIDTHGNTITYHYTEETNRYAQNLGSATATYTRGGTLARIEYGTRVGVTGPAAARVVFEAADRCVPGTNCAVRDGTAWPDVPWDADCAAAPCNGKYSPTFWSTKRLASITTQISGGHGTYTNVESWRFEHTYPNPSDGTKAALWLSKLTQSAGSHTMPPVTFGGASKPNRVDSPTDGLPAMNKFRMSAVDTETGGTTNVRYADPDCAPGATPTAADSNLKRCFPVRWTMPPSTTPVNDWFHKYVVSQVSEVDRVGGGRTQVTEYEYLGGAAWAYDDNPLLAADRRTWSRWRGYGKVVIRRGDAVGEPDKPRSESEHLYFRGMDGDRLASGATRTATVNDSSGGSIADDAAYAGVEREMIVRNGVGGAVVSSQLNTPWRRETAVQGSLRSNQVEVVRTVGRTTLASGNFRITEVESVFDEHGNAYRVHDKGDTAVATDDLCTTTSYVKNASAWIMSLPSEIKTVGVACGASVSYPEDAVLARRMSYDDGAPGAAPTRGDVTRTELAKSYENGAPVYLTTARSTVDFYGRPTVTYDALNHATKTSYTETNGLTTSVAVTNPLGHVSTTSYRPAFGQASASVDPNGRRTDLSHDAFGRLTAIWKPGRSKDIGDGPNVRYAYGIQSDAPSWVRTETLTASSTYAVSYELLDGFLRSRQTQTPSPKGGRVLTDTTYDSRGLKNLTRAAYYNKDAAPVARLYEPADEADVPAATQSLFDGAERLTASIQLSLGVERWRETTSYSGDTVTTIPPRGGITRTTVADARGRTVELRQHKPGGYDSTRYTYTSAGAVDTVTDAAGNQWNHDYDVMGRKVRSTDPDKGVSLLTYDDLGRPVTVTDGRGRTLASLYDQLGRRTESRLGSTTGPLVAKWTYDTVAKGALTSSARYLGSAAYVRTVTGIDPAGRPKGESVSIPATEAGVAGTYTSSVTYRADGSVASLSLPALGDVPAETLTYDYDALGRPVTMIGAAKYVSATEYNELGEKSQRTLGDIGQRVWQTTYYDEGTRRLGRVLTERERTGQLLAVDEVYDYDPAGNVTRTANLVAGSAADTQCFAYDHLRRVTDAWTATDNCTNPPSAGTVDGPDQYWQTYSYDVSGNRTSVTTHGGADTADKTLNYSYPPPGSARPHAVTSISGGPESRSYGYDGAGNVVSRPGPAGPQALAWNDDGTLDSISGGGLTTSYVYDANGAQLLRRQGTKLTLFIGEGDVTFDTATATKTGTRYYQGVGVRTAAGVRWLISDQQNTAKVAIDSATLTTTARRLDLFGNPRGTASGWNGGSRGFVEGAANDGTGLIRLGLREYDPALGRFLSVDPIIDPTSPQTLNAYSYASNNPATLSDPSGLRADYDDCRCNYNANPPRIYGPHQNEVPWWCRLGACQRSSKPLPKWPAWHPPMRIAVGERGARGAQEHGDRQWRRYQAELRARLEEDRKRWAARDQRIKDEIEKTIGTQLSDAQAADVDRAIDEFRKRSFHGWIWSASFCMELSFGAIVGGASEQCLNIDQFGMTRSVSGKLGLNAGVEVSVTVGIKLNTEGAADIAKNPGQVSVSGGLRGGLGPYGRLEGEVELPFSGTSNGSIAMKLGVGAGGSVGGAYIVTRAENTGYFVRW